MEHWKNMLNQLKHKLLEEKFKQYQFFSKGNNNFIYFDDQTVKHYIVQNGEVILESVTDEELTDIWKKYKKQIKEYDLFDGGFIAIKGKDGHVEILYNAPNNRMKRITGKRTFVWMNNWENHITTLDILIKLYTLHTLHN